MLRNMFYWKTSECVVVCCRKMLVGSDHFPELSSYNSFMGNSDIDQSQSLITSTYTELTPLQPMSPVKTDHDSACMVDLNNLQCYENLEPLKPTAMLNDHGQFEPCTQPSSISSFCGHSYFLPPVDCLELAKMLSRENVDGRSSETRNNLAKVPSTESESDVGNSSTASGSSTPTRSVALSTDIEELDTFDVAERVSSELRRFNIPQALFAQTVLSRSQGTLSELLRNPKPWSKMKTGRETYVRMLQWLIEPEAQRLAVLRRAGHMLTVDLTVHTFEHLLINILAHIQTPAIAVVILLISLSVCHIGDPHLYGSVCRNVLCTKQ